MNSVQSRESVASSTPPSRNLTLWAGWVSITQGLLIFVPTFVLGAAINWPASVDDPAATALPRLLENEGAVRLGYLSYLVYSILFAVTIALLVRYANGKVLGVLGAIIIGFAAASALARSIGIVRWLAPMPELAQMWEAAGTDDQRASIAVLYETLNSYGGTIGEMLGVSIFAALAIGALSIGALKTRAYPAWIGVFGLIAAITVLGTAVELMGVDPGLALTIGTTVVQLWFLAVGIWLLTRGRKAIAS